MSDQAAFTDPTSITVGGGIPPDITGEGYGGGEGPEPGVVGGGPVAALIGNAPPLSTGDYGNAELSQYGELYKEYQTRLTQAAERAVSIGAPIDQWHRVYRAIRREYSDKYTDQRRMELEQDNKQKKVDKELQDKFVTRMAPESTNVPTTQEILTSPMSAAAKENTYRFLHALTSQEPGPTAKESAANQSELYRRLTLPDDDPDKIRSLGEIQRAYHTDKKINWNAMAQLSNEFNNLYSATRSEITKGVADVIKAAQPRIRPSLSMPDGHLMEAVQDPEGPNRELSFKRYVDDQVNRAQQANKNPLATVLNPDSPEFVGKDLKRWQKAGPSLQDRVNAGKGQKFTDPKTIPELQQQYNAGRWGPPGTDEARRNAYTEGLRLNLYAPSSTVAPPVR